MAAEIMGRSTVDPVDGTVNQLTRQHAISGKREAHNDRNA